LLLFILAIFWATFVCQLQSGKNSIWEENSDFFGLENDFFGLKNDIFEKNLLTSWDFRKSEEKFPNKF
jgi:hypothetical protein